MVNDWNGREFSLIDTGGYVIGSDDIFESEIDKQVELAIINLMQLFLWLMLELVLLEWMKTKQLLRKIKTSFFSSQ